MIALQWIACGVCLTASAFLFGKYGAEFILSLEYGTVRTFWQDHGLWYSAVALLIIGVGIRP